MAAMPIETWRYKTQGEGKRHMGPMAGDFREAFGLGDFEGRITAIDADGVALAAIQGLNAKVGERELEIAQLSARVASSEELNARLAAQLKLIEQRLAAMEGMSE